MSKMTGFVLTGVVALSLIVPAVSLAQSDVDTSGDASCAVLSVNLRYRSTDAGTDGAVSVLQDFLNSRGYLSVQPTGFFGSLTRAAAAAFQSANGISATPPGFVGPITRAKIQAIDCNDGNNQTTNGTLSIEPANPSVQVGQTFKVQALYQPPMPPCDIPGVACAQVMPAPRPVVAVWTSSNPAVASVLPGTGAPCPVGSACPDSPVVPGAIIKGNAKGVAEIKAVYTLSPGAILIAKANVTVTNGTTQLSITVLSPNGGEQWTLGTTKNIIWSLAGYSQNQSVKLELRDATTKELIGVICTSCVPSTLAWIVGNLQDATGNFFKASPGQYLVHALPIGYSSGDMSNAPFSIVAAPVPKVTSLLVTPTTAVAGSSVTVTWSVATPTAKDWIGLFQLGSANTANSSWMYANGCSRTSSGSAVAVGSCSFVLHRETGAEVPPSTLSPGSYEFRLFANDLFTLIATSPVVTVTAATTALNNSQNQTASVLNAIEGLTTNTPTSPTPASFTYVWNNNLQIGSPHAEDVSALQRALTNEGVYTGDVTGGFYNQTYAAVQNFQQKYGIEATGFVGPATRSKLNSLYAN